MDPSFFDRLEWRPDRVVLDDHVFQLQSARSAGAELLDDALVLHKGKGLVDQYATFWEGRSFESAEILELGMWEGGSVAFWALFFEPSKHVGIDLASAVNHDGFDKFVATNGGASRIATYWGVDQGDAATLRSIVDKEFSGPLDLVIDDASHLYAPTKASLETLFPLLRPGGFYIIEDWAWAHWPAAQSPTHRWARERALTDLVSELVEAAGSAQEVVAHLTVFQGFVVVERGPAPLGTDFRLEHHIVRRPPQSALNGRLVRAARSRGRRLIARLQRKTSR